MKTLRLVNYPHGCHLYIEAALVLLRNADTYIAGFSQVKSPTNQYISFVLQQEVVRKLTLHHPRTPPLSPRETPHYGTYRFYKTE